MKVQILTINAQKEPCSSNFYTRTKRLKKGPLINRSSFLIGRPLKYMFSNPNPKFRDEVQELKIDIIFFSYSVSVDSGTVKL